MPQKPQRIDAHQHFWHFRPSAYPWIGADMDALRRDRLPECLLPELRRTGIDASIAVQARTDAAETDYLLSLAEQFDWIAGVVGWVDLRADDLPQRLERWQDRRNLLGFRHALQDEPQSTAFMADERFRRGIARLQELGYAYDLLIRSHQLTDTAALCAAVDAHWLVLDHLGKPAIRDGRHDEWRRDIEPLRSMPHVVCKLSGLVTEADLGGGSFDHREIRRYLDSALEIFGAERLMYGSDWPVCQLSASYATVYGIVADWGRALSPGERSALWGGTAARIYALRSAAPANGNWGADSWI
jgi:L-fuconolactonase